ncbi:MAG: YybH family protein [Flavobacteriales bacterium]
MRSVLAFCLIPTAFLLSRCGHVEHNEGDLINETHVQNLVSEVTDELDLNLISEAMNRQEGAWNKGDLDAFMLGYWESDSLTFIGKSGVNKGWATTLNNYKKSYPDTSSMGQLTFTNLEMHKLGENHAYVIGKWYLQRSMGDIGGHYSLIWRKIDGNWVIISDHSS